MIENGSHNRPKMSVSSVFDTDEESFRKMMNIIHNPNPFNKEYTEKHHIIPRFVFRDNGLEVDNSADNMVELSLKNHFIVHYYASKCCKEKYRYKFAVIVTKMLGNIYKKFSEEELDQIATLVEEAKENVRKLGYPESAREKNRLASMGEKNGFYCKKHSEEMRKELSKQRKLWWNEHPECKERLVKMNKENVGKKPWNSKVKNENPNEKVRCGNYNLKGKTLPEEWKEAAKKAQIKSPIFSRNISKYYKQYKEDGGSISWNEFQGMFREMFKMGCVA